MGGGLQYRSCRQLSTIRLSKTIVLLCFSNHSVAVIGLGFKRSVVGRKVKSHTIKSLLSLMHYIKCGSTINIIGRLNKHNIVEMAILADTSSSATL